MKRSKRLALPSVFVLGACSAPSNPVDAGYDAGVDAGTHDSGVSDAGYDAGYDAGVPDAGTPDGGQPACPGPNRFNDAGMSCTCELDGIDSDGGNIWFECCDPDLGNPCPVCCFNPRIADGGRGYILDDGGIGEQPADGGGQAACYC